MSTFKLLFAEYFEINESILEEYGALNLCLSSDLPLFIDPFLLFASDKPEYKELHKNVVSHLLVLKDLAIENRGDGVNFNLFRFPEIKQNWLGLSKYGNGGKGLGKRFATNIIASFNGFYNSFGQEQISADTHIEKLTLMNPGVGKDFISDFTTNLILDYLLKFTEQFALKYLKPDQYKIFSVRSQFDSTSNIWMPKKYNLPYFFREDDGDFIILTPLDILTKDDAVINNTDFSSKFRSVASSIKNRSLRDAINDFFRRNLPKKPKKNDKDVAFRKTVLKFPELIDYYIKGKEDKKGTFSKLSKEKVDKLIDGLTKSLTPLCEILHKKSDFYKIYPDSYEESLKRANYLKDVIENNDGYRIFYYGGKAISNEDTVQRIFKLTWYASPYDVNSEVNNGRGPADYKVSFGSGD